MDRVFLLLASLIAGLAVLLGAFGAHALRARLAGNLLVTLETGVRYQMYHALALFAVGLILSRSAADAWLVAAGWLFIVGIVLFSGSLYLLVLTGARRWGAVTPLGGIAFILGWLFLAWAVWSG